MSIKIMAWERCPWCQQNLNGYNNTIGHYQREHPTEYGLRQAFSACQGTKNTLQARM